jgi:hypothetical protein
MQRTQVFQLGERPLVNFLLFSAWPSSSLGKPVWRPCFLPTPLTVFFGHYGMGPTLVAVIVTASASGREGGKSYRAQTRIEQYLGTGTPV